MRPDSYSVERRGPEDLFCRRMLPPPNSQLLLCFFPDGAGSGPTRLAPNSMAAAASGTLQKRRGLVAAAGETQPAGKSAQDNELHAWRVSPPAALRRRRNCEKKAGKAGGEGGGGR